ncbi:hypothetical protein PILCRDRAFT_471888 [Piloderma croceum F 1598]|uniref:Pre-rRNA-processing protein RIX1 n=1 Tax=Piloderma croceum (strain F 1598) TaxID=765440 RepID=A0A0C3BXY2_PILCF|nr:hypothetical protein PILCRDRAFT_471888 [Piloderma croceum F 1598]
MASASAQLAVDRQVKVISDFEYNLAPDRIPSTNVTVETAQKAIKLAIVSMTLITVEIRRDPTFIRTYSSNFRNAWKGVWTWLEFLHTQCVVRQEYGETLMLQSLRIIPFIINVFTRGDRNLRKDIQTTPGIFRKLVPHYLQEGDDNTQDRANIETKFDFSAAMMTLLQDVEFLDTTVLPSVVEAADGGAGAIAQVTVDRLRVAIAKTPPDLSVIESRLCLLSIFTINLYRPLRSAMLLHKSLPIIIDTMNMIDAQPAHSFVAGTGHSTFASLVMLCFKTLFASLESSNGSAWIAKAIDAGLLPVVLQLSRRLAQAGVDPLIAKAVSKKVLDVVQEHLVYRSVLHRLAKALRKIDRTSISDHLPEPILGGWVTFKAAATSSLELKSEFEAARKTWEIEPGCFGCQFPDVSLPSCCRLRSDRILNAHLLVPNSLR